MFAEKYNADLANNLGNLVSRVLNMVEKYCDGKVDREVASSILLEGVGVSIESLQFDRALKQVWEGITAANTIIDAAKPWDLAKDPGKKKELSRHLAGLVSFLYDAASALLPFMPATSETIIGCLSSEKITKGEPLFKRIT
jgi:methionyl-tRNA synthetase